MKPLTLADLAFVAGVTIAICAGVLAGLVGVLKYYDLRDRAERNGRR